MTNQLRRISFIVPFNDEKDELRNTNIDPNGSDCKPYLLRQSQTPKKIALEMVVERWGFLFNKDCIIIVGRNSSRMDKI
jgi:hypothetical protein